MIVDEGCVCGSIGAHVSDVRMCVARDANGNEHHRYWRGDQELVSVTRILKWAFKPDFSAAPPHVLANARLRGVVTDQLFSKYLNGELKVIPIGTRLDSLRLFLKLRRWWGDHKHGERVRSQVILSDDRTAGCCDVLDEEKDTIFDVKATYNIEKFYAIQLAGYACLFFETFKRPLKKAGIVHVTERYPEPRLIPIDLVDDLLDWVLIKDAFFAVQRRSKRS